MTTAHMLEYVDEGLTEVGEDAELRAGLVTALWNLTEEAQRTRSVELAGLVMRVAIVHTPMTEFSPEKLGDFLLDNVAAVVAMRQEFLESGRDSLERDLSLLASTQFRVQDARPNREFVMDANREASKRQVEA